MILTVRISSPMTRSNGDVELKIQKYKREPNGYSKVCKQTKHIHNFLLSDLLIKDIYWMFIQNLKT